MRGIRRRGRSRCRRPSWRRRRAPWAPRDQSPSSSPIKALRKRSTAPCGGAGRAKAAMRSASSATRRVPGSRPPLPGTSAAEGLRTRERRARRSGRRESRRPPASALRPSRSGARRGASRARGRGPGRRRPALPPPALRHRRERCGARRVWASVRCVAEVLVDARRGSESAGRVGRQTLACSKASSVRRLCGESRGPARRRRSDRADHCARRETQRRPLPSPARTLSAACRGIVVRAKTLWTRPAVAARPG